MVYTDARAYVMHEVYLCMFYHIYFTRYDFKTLLIWFIQYLICNLIGYLSNLPGNNKFLLLFQMFVVVMTNPFYIISAVLHLIA